MTYVEFVDGLASLSELPRKDAAAMAEAVFGIISRELSVGEPVKVAGLGEFYTVKYPGGVGAGADGAARITLPSVEPEFEPDEDLAATVSAQVAAHPELFARPELPDMPDPDAPLVMPDEVPAAPATAEFKPAAAAEAAPVPDPAAPPARNEAPLGRASFIEFVDLSGIRVEKDVLQLLPLSLAQRYGAVPLRLEEGTLTVAMIDPEDFDALQVIRKATGLTVKPALATRDGVSGVIDQYTGLAAEVQEAIDAGEFDIVSAGDVADAAAENFFQDDQDAPTVHIVQSLLRRAVKEKASDIHVEPGEKKVAVRFRLDGVLTHKVDLPKEIQGAVIARLKILANLKIDEQRLPQDGRFSMKLDGKEVDFRFSTIPVVNGEKIVMRILDKSVGILAIEDVGLIGRGFDVLTNNLKRSHGMILVTGPTGSGKTTSLYAVLGRMMSPDVNILTLEDPVEYRVEGVNQSQVHAAIGYSFAAGLRAVVRQDPDIVMLGEIRDHETAEMAVQAALTGHIVLSTLHTNDSAGAFPRLIDMGIEPFLLTSSIHTVIAQRLARKVCQECKVARAVLPKELDEVEAIIATMPEEVRKELGRGARTFYMGSGCSACGGKGYKGRMGVFEVLDVSEPIRDLVLQRSSGATITEQAVGGGMVTMLQDGILKALDGRTSLEEVWRVTRE